MNDQQSFMGPPPKVIKVGKHEGFVMIWFPDLPAPIKITKQAAREFARQLVKATL